MKKSVFKPCVKCNIGGGCCGCKKHKEWEKWRNSLTNEEWNDFVKKECEKEKKVLDKQYKSLMVL